MAFSSNTYQTRTLASCLAFITLISQCLAADIAYCSFLNTGSAFQYVYNQYQSNGACVTTCGGSYAYAVLSGADCWCSNYTPATSTSTSDCDVSCPGYGSDWCGDPARGLYAYIALSGHSPYGIAGASSFSQSTSSSVSTPPTSLQRSSSTSFGGQTSLTVIATTQSIRTSFNPVVPLSTATEASSTPATSSKPVIVPSSTSTTPTPSPTPVTSVAPPGSTTLAPTQILTSVITVTGQVKTILVTPTSPSDSSIGSSSASSGGNGVSAGKVAGIVIGVALGLGILIGLGVWYWLRHRHRAVADAASTDGLSNHGASNQGVPSRQVSQMSSAGLLGRPPRILTAGLATTSGPKSPESSQLDRRSLGTDQRLNPYAIYAHEESRLSNVSLQDNQDYSRQLRVANPDP